MAGDFNTDLLPAPGVATCFTSQHGERTLAQDQHRFQDLVSHQGLTALNTRCREATFRDPGRSESRVDFVLVRGRQVRGQIRAQPQLHFASWRNGARHLALAGRIRLFHWTQVPVVSEPANAVDKDAV